MAIFKAANLTRQMADAGELFIMKNPRGIAPIVYIRDGNNLKAFDIQNLVPTIEGKEARRRFGSKIRDTGAAYYLDESGNPIKISSGSQIADIAIKRFNKETGLDYYNLPQKLVGDEIQAIQQGGGQFQGIKDINEFQNVVNNFAPGGNIDISQGQTFDPVTKQLKDASGNVIGSTAGATGTLRPASPNDVGGQTQTTPSLSLPQSNLKPGDTGAEVRQLQDYLVSQGFLTQAELDTGPGTFGPRTTAAVKRLQEKLGVDNSTGPGFFGPRTRASLQNQGLSLKDQQAVIDDGVSGGLSRQEAERIARENAQVATQSLPSVIQPPRTGIKEAPNLPQPEAPSVIEQQGVSVAAQVEADRKALETRLQNDLATVQSKIDKANENITELTTLQADGIDKAGEVLQPFRKALEDAERERLYINKNFEANQALVDELDTLLTEGNALIKQQKEVTGLSAIRNPRIAKTIEDVNARAGVIQAVIAARNGQINTASTLIDRSIEAINADKKDQLAYYDTLINFYEKQKDDEGKKLIRLEKDKRDFLNAQINLLSNDLARSEENAQAIKEMMTDPETALFIAKAGISLNDSPETINAKLARQAEFDAQNEKLSPSEAKALGVPYGTTRREAEGIIPQSGGAQSGGKAMSENELLSFETTYGWRPPFGLSFNEALQFMQENPQLSPTQLERQALASVTGVQPQAVEVTGEELNQAIKDVRSAFTDVDKTIVKRLGITGPFGRADLNTLLSFPFVQELIQLGLQNGHDTETIVKKIIQKLQTQ